MIYLIIIVAAVISRLISKFSKRTFLGTLILFIIGTVFAVMTATVKDADMWNALAYIFFAITAYAAMIIDVGVIGFTKLVSIGKSK